MIRIYIHGKFTTASRKVAKVSVSGNNVYVTEGSFEKYANYKCFWVFSNDKGENNENTSSNETSNSNENSVNYTRYVSTDSYNLNVRNGAGINNNIIGSLEKGTKVNVSKVSGSWSYITSPIKGWVSNRYLSSTSIADTSSYSTGKYQVTASLLHVRTGSGTNYKLKTFSQLSTNARYQNEKYGNYYALGYLRGVVCDVTEVNGNWGKTTSGWICLDYCKKL